MPRWYVLSPLSLLHPCAHHLVQTRPSVHTALPRFFSFGSHNGGGGSHTHPCLVTRTILSLVTRAFGLRYFTPDYRGYPHPKRRRPTPRLKTILLLTPLCFYRIFTRPRRVLSPVIFLSPRPYLQRAPFICLIHTICYSYASHFHHLHLSHRHRYSRPSSPSPRWVIRLSCTECNDRSDLRLW